MFFAQSRLVLKLGGTCGIAAAITLVLGFLVGENVAAAFAGTVTSYGEPAGTLQTYGEPLEDLLVRLVKAGVLHIVSRIFLFAASLLSIPMLLALYFVMTYRKTPYRFLSLIGLVLGIAAATSFAISHVVTGPLSLDIANQYVEASTDLEKREIIATAEELDASIGLTALDNIFMIIGLVLISILLLTFGLAMVKTRLFARWLGWSSILVGMLSIVGFTVGSLTGLGGIALAPASMFGIAWFILTGYNVHRLSRDILAIRT
jgi:hypothetical protein